MIVEDIIPRNMIINLGCASVDNHIPRDDIFDYHPLRECNIYIISHANKIMREFSGEKFHWSNSDPKMSDRPYQVIDRSYHTR